MIKLIFKILQSGFGKVDTGFAVSARCIFVHKNNLALHSFGRSGTGNASELGFPELKDSSTFPRLS
ncbi:MAG TPA: hypothetical protein PLV21_03980 [Cyclobacteriaceae bacterium]|nr:hypothetical protein [Cyclobacteriaceae bacterium]HRJ81019.1 hypothetical protein [Cyclobacteriaceae bacterium]